MFEERIQQSLKTRILWALIELLDKPKALPKVGEEFTFIAGARATHLDKAVRSKLPKDHPLYGYGFIEYQVKSEKMGVVHAHMIVNDSPRVRKLLKLVNEA